MWPKTSAPEGGEWSAARPGRTLPPGKTRYTLYRRLGGPQGRSGQAENLAPTGIRSPDRSAPSHSLYRLSCPESYARDLCKIYRNGIYSSHGSRISLLYLLDYSLFVKVLIFECVLLVEAPSSGRISCPELQVRFARLAALNPTLFCCNVMDIRNLPIQIFFFLWRCNPTRVMASSFLRFLDHTQRRTTVGRTPLDELSARRRDRYLTTHNTHNRQTSMSPV